MWSVRCFSVLAFLAFTVGGSVAAVPDYPVKPLRYVAASAAGGASDIIARTVGAALSDQLGVSVVVDNRPGAGNVVGAEVAAKAPPDGYTIFGCNIASMAVAPAQYRKLPYDPERDFAPIGLAVSNPNVFTVHPSLPAKTIPQFVNLAKAYPGKLNYGATAAGSSPQLSMELLKLNAKINVVHIAYKGASIAVLDLIAGRVEAMASTVPSAFTAIRGGKVRALAVTSLERDPDLPEVPTIAESGYPDFEVISWQGVCTQAAVPPAVLARLRTAFNTALAQPDLRKRLTDAGFMLNILPADKFAAFMNTERAKWAKVVRAANIPLQ